MPEEPAAPATGTEGQPNPEPPATPPAEPPAAPQPDPSAPSDPKPTETVDFWKQKARDQEKRAKANAGAVGELEQLKASMMSDQEKAVAEAEARGRKAATTDVGQRLAAAELKAALTGVIANPAEIVEDLNLARYVTSDGDVDQEAVEALRKKYEGLSSKPAEPKSQRPTPNLRTVPVAEGEPLKTDMNSWMRRKASSE